MGRHAERPLKGNLHNVPLPPDLRVWPSLDQLVTLCGDGRSQVGWRSLSGCQELGSSRRSLLRAGQGPESIAKVHFENLVCAAWPLRPTQDRGVRI